jgi:hypothetical protein
MQKPAIVPPNQPLSFSGHLIFSLAFSLASLFCCVNGQSTSTCPEAPQSRNLAGSSCRPGLYQGLPLNCAPWFQEPALSTVPSHSRPHPNQRPLCQHEAGTCSVTFTGSRRQKPQPMAEEQLPLTSWKDLPTQGCALV